MSILNNRGVVAALGAALLFGVGTPVAKLLLGEVSPWLLAGLLYLGSGLGLAVLRLLSRRPTARLAPGDWPWLVGAVVSGGMIGPALLMWGLASMPASGVALLLNAESVFTVAIAWVVFRENIGRRLALGMFSILAGALVLSWPGTARFGATLPTLAVIGACLAWGIDNNLTRKVALADASFIAMVKGLAAGATNLVLALAAGAALPSLGASSAAMTLGFFSYGLSLMLFVMALRHLGTARTGAYFSIAPFAGALIAMPLLGEAPTWPLLIAASLMGVGIWLHLTERHEHLHPHAALEHSHQHAHDEHHQHEHAEPTQPDVQHTHTHQHEPISHTHPHYPDVHHRHDH